VKLVALVIVTPLVVTSTVPDVAPAGIVVVMVLSVEEVTTAGVPLKDTPGELSKLVPEMVMVAPTAPFAGLRLEMVGEGSTVKFDPLLTVTEFTVTDIFPVPAPTGTEVVILVADDEETIAVTPLKLTVLLVGVMLKLFPSITMVAPTAPLVGLKPVIIGVGNTMKSSVLTTVTPFTVMEIFPVEAPLGTVVVMLFEVDALTTAVVLLNFTI